MNVPWELVPIPPALRWELWPNITSFTLHCRALTTGWGPVCLHLPWRMVLYHQIYPGNQVLYHGLYPGDVACINKFYLRNRGLYHQFYPRESWPVPPHLPWGIMGSLPVTPVSPRELWSIPLIFRLGFVACTVHLSFELNRIGAIRITSSEMWFVLPDLTRGSIPPVLHWRWLGQQLPNPGSGVTHYHHHHVLHFFLL